jgi:AraC-like DNA-binding protein
MAQDLVFLHGRHTPKTIACVDKRFDYHTLQLMSAGSVRISYDDRAAVLEGAWVWPCMPGPQIRFHEWSRGKAWDHRYVAFSGTRVGRWAASGLLLDAPQHIETALHDRLKRLFDELYNFLHEPRRWAEMQAANTLERILLLLAEDRERQSAQQTEAWLVAVLDELSDLSKDRPYEQLAADQNMSLPTLRRRFFQATGSPIHMYRIRHRIAHAKRRLAETDLTLETIADELNYNDVHYFSRQFKKIAGVTPGAYRRSVQPR